jgi:hypothetical protein
MSKKVTKRTKRTKRIKNTRKNNRRRRNMRGGETQNSSWVDPPEVDTTEECPICSQAFDSQHAVYKTSCGHLFHNDCLNQWCETSYDRGSELTCPTCRANIQDEDCPNIWAFKNKALEEDTPDFRDKPELRAIYVSQPDE